MTSDSDAFLHAVLASGLELPPDTRGRLLMFADLVVDRSEALNLVSRADRPRFLTRHVQECLAPALVARAAAAGTLVDIGSGAGLPGIPLAIVCPGVEALLVEPRLRRAQFLETAIARLGLSRRVHVFHGTAERLGRNPDRPLGAGLATARAVDRLENLWIWCQALLRPGGWLVTFKGAEETEGARLLDNPCPAAVEVEAVPGAPRVLLMVQIPAR